VIAFGRNFPCIFNDFSIILNTANPKRRSYMKKLFVVMALLVSQAFLSAQCASMKSMEGSRNSLLPAPDCSGDANGNVGGGRDGN
jgi:hypothetical protein